MSAYSGEKLRLPIVKIKDLRRGLKDLEVVGEISSIMMNGTSESRHAIARLEDETGAVALNLWNVQLEQVKVGDRVRLRGAFTRKKGRVLSLSLWGDVEVLPKG